MANVQATILNKEFENYIFKIIATSPRDQWVNKVTSPHVLQVELEISAQLDFFQTLAGYHPLYVDGHQQAHILPGLADTFARVLCKHGVYSTRLPYEPNIAECDWIDAPRQGFYQEVSQLSLDARATFDHWGIW